MQGSCALSLEEPIVATRKPPTRRLASIPTAAEYAAVCTKTIRRRISDGSLTGYRMGPRVIRVDLDELDALLRPIPTIDRVADIASRDRRAKCGGAE